MSGTTFSKLPVMIVALVIGLILTFTAVMPLVSDYSEAKTFKNEGYYTMDQLDDNTSRVIKWSKTTLNIINVDGKDIDMSSFVDLGKSYTLIGSEKVVIRYEKDSATFAGIQGYYVGSGGYVAFHSNTAAETGTEVTITVSSGSISVVSNGTTPISVTISDIGEDGYIINPEGTGTYAIMKKANVPAYVLGDSDIRLIGVSVGAGPNGIALYGSGSIDDGITISTIYKPNTITTVTYSEPEVTDTEISGYTKDVYSLEKYTFTITYDANTYDATYSYFIVPASITVDPDNPTVYKNLVSVLPLFALILLVAGAASLVYFKNKD